MDSWWWLAVGAVVVLALVVALSDAFGRSGRPARRRRPPARPGERARGGVRPRPPAGPRPGRPGGPERGGPERAPRAGEIWWADVPYEDGPGSKDRPCLVLSVRGGTALVAKITSRHHEERPGVIALPAGSVGDARGRASFLETDELREVPVRGFRRRVGRADPAVWARVRHLAA